MANNSSDWNYFNISAAQTKILNESKFLDIPRNVLYGIYVFNGILALIGVSGNLFVCFVIIRGRKMYTIANLFLMNLAIADLFILGISYPLWIIQAAKPDEWPFGEALCKIIPPVSDAFYGVSLGCIMAISVHRYRMIIHPMGTQMAFIQAKSIIIFFYGISLLSISAPLYPVMRYKEIHVLRNVTNETKMVEQIKRYCYWKWPSWNYERYYMTFLLSFWYIIPLLIILCTYVRIKCYLQEQIKYHWLSNSKNDMAIKSHVLGIKNAMRLLAPVVIVFSILMLPWNILRAISVFKRINELDYFRAYLLVASTMLVTNSAVNPFIYYITANDFRLEFRKQFRIVLKLFNLSNEKNDACFVDTNKHRQFELGGRVVGSRSSQTTQTENVYANGPDDNEKNAGPDFDEMFRNYYRGQHNVRNPAFLNVTVSAIDTLPEEVFEDTEVDSKYIDTKVGFDVNQNSQLLPDLERTYEKGISERFWEECAETIL